MQVTSIGHAGFRIDTAAGSILCDPWVNPAYFASWFPFPDNSGLDWDALGDCDYLYVSHLHKDHFDAKLLTEHVNKDATVLLPDYPVPDLKNALQMLGFHHFFETTDSVKHRLSGSKGELDIMIIALRAPADGPIGDSGLVVSDGVTTAFQLSKTYSSGPASWTRVIAKPVAGTLRLAVAGTEHSTGFSLDTATGVVTFAAAPATGASLTAGFEFDTPVRFDTDALAINLATFTAGEIPSIPLVEILL